MKVLKVPADLGPKGKTFTKSVFRPAAGSMRRPPMRNESRATGAPAQPIGGRRAAEAGGFASVELLVVIVIIAILGAMLLPLRGMETANPFTPPNFPTPAFPERSYNVKEFGATGGGVTNDTPAINQAIAQCSAAGGGTVYFPAGRYAAGSIHLKSNVHLRLDTRAVIFGLAGAFEPAEPNPFSRYQDGGHSYFHNALMWGENIENVAISGGTINGGGSIGHHDPKPGNGDKLIAIKVGRNLHFQNLMHEKGGHFVYLLNDCQGVTFERIVIKESRDAVDLMGCRNVQIHDCRFTGCDDDTIGIKSDYCLGRKINSANIYVWDSYFETKCNALQFGSETAGDFHNINFWNIRVGRANKAAIGITTGDGGIIDGVNYSNIVVNGATCPIYMLVWDRLRTGEPGAKAGNIKNVHITDVTITGCVDGGVSPVQCSAITGMKESPLENITLENVSINYPGGGTNAAAANIVPPYPTNFPPRSLGPRPASAFYLRHIKGLTLKNVQLTFDKPDARPPLVVSDVDGLTFDDFKSQKSAGGETMRLEQVKHFTVRDSAGLRARKDVSVEKARE